MPDQPPRPARVLKFRRPSNALVPRGDRLDSDPDATAAPVRDGLPTVPIPPAPYRPSTDWGDDTPEEIRIADTLLLWLLSDRHPRETWTFARHSVRRAWAGSMPPRERRLVSSPAGRGREACHYLWELAGDIETGGAWRRVIEVLWHSVLIRYEITTVAGTGTSPSVTLDRISESRAPKPVRS